MPEIIFYHTNCPKCKILKRKLDEKNIQYIEVTDPKQLISKGFSSVPILQIDKAIYTFSEAIKLLKEW